VSSSPPRLSRATLDGLLLLMVLIWGGNYSLVKATFREIPPLPFNTLRLLVAAAVFAASLIATRLWMRRRGRPLPRALYTEATLSRRDWLGLLGLGLIGHLAYQWCFIQGIAHTSASNGALILGCTPVAVALLSAAVGQERIGRVHWLGAGLSILGLYLVAGRNGANAGSSILGDALMLVAVACWSVYTVLGRPLLERHSPLFITGTTMGMGALAFAATTWWAFDEVRWGEVSGLAWVSVIASALLALNLAYLIYYVGVQRLGSARTAMFSNMVPVAGMVVAWLTLGEPAQARQIGGAAAIVAGILLTRLSRPSGPRPAADVPAEG
jgi:drug/metabolite transporter (DMT)-like permease